LGAGAPLQAKHAAASSAAAERIGDKRAVRAMVGLLWQSSEAQLDVGRRAGQAQVEVGGAIAVARQLDLLHAVVERDADVTRREPLDADRAAVDVAVDVAAVLL